MPLLASNPAEGFGKTARRLAMMAGLLALLALIGWASGNAALTSIVPGYVSMMPNTAICLILGAIAVHGVSLESEGYTWRVSTSSAFLLLTGLLTLAEYAFGTTLGVDYILFPKPAGAILTSSPGRMSPSAATCFVCIGTALFAIDRRAGRLRHLSEFLTICTMVISSFALINCLYGGTRETNMPTSSCMAINTAIAFVLLASAILMTRPRFRTMNILADDTLGGVTVRRLLPITFLILLFLGWLRLQGELAGWYNSKVGLSLMVTSDIAIIGLLILWHAWAIRNVEITRRRTEDRTAADEVRNRTILNSIQSAIVTIDETGRMLSVNTSTERLFGYSSPELLGRNVTMLIPPSYREQHEQAVRRYLETGVSSIIGIERETEVGGLRKDGIIVPIGIRVSETRHEGRRLFIGILHDITARVQIRQVLVEQEERLRATFEQTGVGIAHMALDGRWLRVNARMCDIVGYSEEELILKTFQEITHPDDLETCLAQIGEVLAGTRPVLSMEKRYLRKYGDIAWVSLTASLIHDAQKKPKYFVAIVEEISSRKQAEEDLQKSQEHLEQSQKLEAIGRLAGGVAHDFNNILSAVIGFSDLALRRLRPDDPVHGQVTEIRKAGERAAGVTRQLLAFSRQQVLSPRVINLNTVLHEVRPMLERLIGEDVEFIMHLQPDLDRVRIDTSQIEQVLLNLAVNSRDAMPGGGKLVIETENVVLDAAYAAEHPDVTPGPHVRFTVSDTGTGMDEKTRARAFEPFFTTKERGKGTGLGLSTVFGIIKQSGGHIHLYSEPGHGTTFKIYLPRVEGAEEPLQAPPPANASGGTETMLLVEDDEGVRNFAIAVLEDAGYTVLAFAQPEEALKACGRHSGPIQILLTDVVMPGMSGRDLAKQANEVRPDLRVLFMSGYTENAIVHHGVLDEGIHFIGKPFTPNSLLQKIREVLDG